MNRPWTCLAAASLAIATLFPPARPAAAAPLYDWGRADVRTYEDPAGDTRHGRGPYIACLDIVSARHAFDGTYHYFRIDLAVEPSMGDIPEELKRQYYDARYGIYVNSGPDGARDTDRYVPQIPWIDLRENRIDAILDAKLGDWNHKFRYWNGTDFTGTTDLAFQRTGATLEWKVKADFGADFTWHAATMLPGQGPHKKTFDHAYGNQPPIPAPGAVRLPGR